MVTGFWALADEVAGHAAGHARWRQGIVAANRQHDYPEYLDASDGSPGGVSPTAWRAAAEVLASTSGIRWVAEGLAVE